MAVVSWESIEKGNKGGGIFLRLQEGRYKVRIVGRAFEYFSHFEPIRVSCCGKEGNCPICLSGKEASKRYAVNVIDRADGKLKVLNAGKAIFGQLREYFEASKIDPGGKEGPDIMIKVEVPDGDKRRTKYTLVMLNSAPFTEDEKKFIKEKGLHGLDKLFTPKSAEEIASILKGETPATADDKPASNKDATKTGVEISDNDLKW